MTLKTSQPHHVFVRQMPPVIVWGGLEKLMLDWFEHIDFAQCRATLVVSTGGGEAYAAHIKAKNLPVEIIEFPFRQNFQYTQGFFSRFFKTLQLFRQLKPHSIIFFQGSYFDFDLSHVLAGFFASNGHAYMYEALGAPVPVARENKKYFGFIPAVGLWWYVQKYTTRWRAHFSKKILSVSTEVKNRLVSLWGYPAEKIHVIYHGVDLSDFQPSVQIRSDMRRSHGISATQTVLIVVARLAQEKCIHRIIEAFDAIADQTMVLLIGGSGPLEQDLKTLASSKKVREQIRFLGHLSSTSPYLKMSDIFILSSDNEGFGIALVEGLATGLVCLSTKCPGPNEIIEDGFNGFLVDKSTEAVTAGLKKILELSPAERHRMMKNAAESAYRKFDITQRMKESLALVDIPYADTKSGDQRIR
jgi:glycosyltransferase involved in cell wall biosynthesis